MPSQEERSKILERAGLILARARALAYELDRERRSPVGHLLASRMRAPGFEIVLPVTVPELR